MPVRQLPEDLINRIAAGEVVERPASVVKELVENAIDAGASRIVVTTAGGGRSLIRVEDDGVGMDRDDLVLSVERHATSNLQDVVLDDIRTLGFRVVALASFGAVAHLIVSSRTADAATGLRIEVDRSRKSGVAPQAMNRGTIVEVRDLFAGVPARLKFLKSDRAEAAAVADVIKRLAMANPDSVPAGKYGKAALEQLGIWSSVERRVARAENVRAALALVSRGEAPFGIVYATDAHADKGVRIVDTFPAASHPPIIYPAAVTRGSQSAPAKALLDYLGSDAARSTWQKYGFALAK